jgi:hypothetical protein
VEVNEVFLPEFFSVDWTPSQVTFMHLLLEFVDGAELFVVVIEMLLKLLKEISDVFINPVSVF